MFTLLLYESCMCLSPDPSSLKEGSTTPSYMYISFFFSFLREFIEKHYVGLKKVNPNFPFLIRECSGIEPRIYARYGKTAQRMTIEYIPISITNTLLYQCLCWHMKLTYHNFSLSLGIVLHNLNTTISVYQLGLVCQMLLYDIKIICSLQSM